MNGFDDIKNLWVGQPAGIIPDITAIKQAAQKTRRTLVLRNVLLVLSLTASLVIVAMVGFFADFQFLTTRIAVVIIIISVSGAIVINSQLLYLVLMREDQTLDNRAYLQQLLSYQNKQRFFQTTGVAVYYVLLTSGLMLYLYEFYARNPQFGIIAYALTLAWIAFTWFYIKPRTIKKQEKKIEELIMQLQSISSQLDKQ